MPRIKSTDPSVKFQVHIPGSVYAKVSLELFSEVEGKIPFGALSYLVTDLLRKWLSERGISA